MSKHFTYEEQLTANQLMQGDVIRRTPEIEELLKLYHPYYFEKTENRFFIIVTQSCDLVQRAGGVCSSRYITLAAVRPLQWVLESELSRQCNGELEAKLKFLDLRRETTFRQFIERLFNNNEPRFFYLHREPSAALNQDLCAILQLTVPLKASENYEAVLSGKTLQLREAFQHKLGYLVGNAYGRVGTKDWTDHIKPEQFRALVGEAFNSVHDSVNWHDNKEHEQIRDRLQKLPSDQWTVENYAEIVQQVRRTKEKRLLDLDEIIRRSLSELGCEDSQIKRAVSSIRNDPKLSTILK